MILLLQGCGHVVITFFEIEVVQCRLTLGNWQKHQASRKKM